MRTGIFQCASLLIITISSGLFAESPTWQRTETKDAGTGAPIHRFVLEGEYLETPKGNTKLDIPTIVLVCAGGKLIRNYGLVRTVLWNGGAKIDMVIDGGKKKTASVDVMATRDRAITDDAAERTFSTFDVAPILSDILHGKKAILSVRDDIGSFSSAPVIPLLIELAVPDPTPVFMACGLK